MSILAVNAGSSSLKLSLFDRHANKLLREGSDLRDASGNAREVRVIGHRFVHGGSRFTHPVLITRDVAMALRELSDLAPLHNPASVKAFEKAHAMFPNAQHVAVFDTAFFSGLPERAFIYPVPYEWFIQWGVRRYGFHGISHEYCALRAREMLGSSARRLVICHLGSGCSASALLDGKPIATSMGFTPMEGLMMATRSGSIDPGILLHLAKQHGLSFDDLETALNKSSGLLGVSGISSDYREVEKAAAARNRRAQLALDIYSDSIISIVGSFTALLGGLDALVFTAGVGENRHSLRASVCERLSWLGVRLNAAANENCAPDKDVAGTASRVHVLVIHTREDLMIAQAARECAKGN